MRTAWSPTRTTNGWFPHLSPSGEWVLYGFWETHLAHFATGTEYQLRLHDTTRIHPLGWLTATTYLVATDTTLYTVDATTQTPTPLLVPDFEGVNFGNAEAGSWGVYLVRSAAHAVPYCIKNGVRFHPEIAQYGCYVSGAHLLTSDMSTNYDILHFKDDTLVRRLPADNKYRVNSTGDVITGYYGALQCYPWNQGRVDATITPWRREEPGALVRVDGELWIWSATDSDTGDLWILGRRLGETTPILLPAFPSVQTSAIWDGTQFVIAGNSDTGALQVRWVSRDTPRTDIHPRVSRRPIPPTLPPLDITITSCRPSTGPAPLTVRAIASSPTATRIDWTLTTATASTTVGVGETLTTTLTTPGRYTLTAAACRMTERVTTGRVREIIVDAPAPPPDPVPVIPPTPTPVPVPAPDPGTVPVPVPTPVPVPAPDPVPVTPPTPTPVPVPVPVIPPTPTPVPDTPAPVSWWIRLRRRVRAWLRRWTVRSF